MLTRGLIELTRRPLGGAPVQLPQLTAAWRFDAGVTDTAGTVSAVAAAYGTTNTLSVASGGTAPTVDTASVEGRNAVLFPGGAVKTLITASNVVLNGAFSIYCGFRADHTSSTRTVFGRDTTNQEAIRVGVVNGTSNITLNARVSSVANFSLVMTRPLTPGWHVLRVSRDAAGLLSIWVDGEQVGSQAGHTGTSTWNAVGYNAAGVNTHQGPLGELLVYDEATTPLTSPQIAAIDTYLEGRWRSPLYVNNATGNNSNDGSRPDRALATITYACGLPLRPGAQIVIEDGQTYNRDPIYFDTSNAAQSSTADRPWVVRRRSNGASRPVITGRDTIAGPWTLVSGNIYKATVALTVSVADSENAGAGRVIDGGVPRRLWTATSNAPTLDQWFYDGTDLFVNVGKDPTTTTILMATRGSLTTAQENAGIRIARPFVTVDGIDVDLYSGNGIRVGHASGGTIVRNVRVTDVALDHYNGASGPSHLFEDFHIERSGRRWGGGGSAGDGITGHGNFAATVRRGTIIYATKGGVANEHDCQVVVEDVTIVSAFLPVVMLNQGGTTPGALTLRRCTITRTADAGQDDAILMAAGTNAASTLTVENCTMTGLGTVRGKAINVGPGVLTQSGNSQTGFNSLT
jgi:hypothetical protein